MPPPAEGSSAATTQLLRTAMPLRAAQLNVGTEADCYYVDGRGEDRGNAGVYVPNVETTRLVRDERGWLRLAG